MQAEIKRDSQAAHKTHIGQFLAQMFRANIRLSASTATITATAAATSKSGGYPS